MQNLPVGFGEDDLRQLFSPFGEVVMSRVLHQGDTSGQGGAALIRMASTDDAARAVQALQGHRLPVGGSAFPLIVRFADNAEIKAKKQAKHISAVISGPPPTRQQHQWPGGGVSGHHTNPHPQMMQPPQSNSPRVNPYGSLSQAASVSAAMALGSGVRPPQLGLHSPFGPSPQQYYGPGSMSPSARPHSGYMGQHDPSGFFMGGGPPDPYHFPRTASMGSGGNVSVGMGGGTMAAVVPGGGPAGSVGGVASLYIKNLPLDADRLFLYEKFAPFGAVLSVKVSRLKWLIS